MRVWVFAFLGQRSGRSPHNGISICAINAHAASAAVARKSKETIAILRVGVHGALLLTYMRLYMYLFILRQSDLKEWEEINPTVRLQTAKPPACHRNE